MVSAGSYLLITISILLVGLNRKDVFGILLRKDFTLTRVSVSYAEALVECGGPDHLIDTRLEESYESFKNIIIPYYTHSISHKSDVVWTSVTRADGATDEWFWYDGELYPYGKIHRFLYDDMYTCSGLKYSVGTNTWIYRAINCPDETEFTLCETQTTYPCYYRMLTGILAVPLSGTRKLLTSVSTLTGCKNDCNKWKLINSRECWMISYNPSASECYIIEYDIMPNDDQTCSWFTYSPEWDTYKRICYDLNVYNATGTLLLLPACALPTPSYVETTTKIAKTSSAADRTTRLIQLTTTPKDRTTTIDTTTMIYTSTPTKSKTTTSIDTTTTSITTSTLTDTHFIDRTTTAMDIAASQKDTTTTSIPATTNTDATTLQKDIFILPIDKTSTTMYTTTTPKNSSTTSLNTITQKDETLTPKDTFTKPIDRTTSRETMMVTDTTTIISKTITVIDTTAGESTTTEQRTTSLIDTMFTVTDTTMLSEDIKTTRPHTTTTFPEDEKITDTDLNTAVVETTTVQIDITEPRETGSGETTIVGLARPENTNKPTRSPETSVKTDTVPIATSPTKSDITTILQDPEMFLETSSIPNTGQTSAVAEAKATPLHSKPPTTYTINGMVGAMSTSVHSTTAQTGDTSPAPTRTYTSDPTNSTCKRVCRCGSHPFNYTSIAEILANLRINVKNTSSYRRLFSSATDDRPLSIGIGWSGAAILILVGTGIFVLDCQRLFQDTMLLCANVRHLSQSTV